MAYALQSSHLADESLEEVLWQMQLQQKKKLQHRHRRSR